MVRSQKKLRSILVLCSSWFVVSPMFSSAEERLSNEHRDVSLRPMSVEDSVNRTDLVGSDWQQGAAAATRGNYVARSIFRVSPDKQFVAFVTRTGSVESGYNNYRLLLYRVADVTAFLRRGATESLPEGVELAKFETPEVTTHTLAQGIDQVTWVNEKSLAFIGRGADGIGQIYQIDIDSRRMRTLTRVPASQYVVGFSLAHNAKKLVYAASVQADDGLWRKRITEGYFVSELPGIEYPYGLNRLDPGTGSFVHRIRYFVVDLDSGKVIPTQFETERSTVPHSLCIDPSARFAVGINTISKVPNEWRFYAPLAGQPLIAGKSGFLQFENGSFGRPSSPQYRLIDLNSGNVVDLVAAPAEENYGRAQTCMWSPDGSSVLLPSTYLPQQGIEDAAERRQRETMPYVVVVDVNAGTITPVIEARHKPADTSTVEASGILGFSWLNNSTVTIEFWLKHRDGRPDCAMAVDYVRDGDLWVAGTPRPSILPKPVGTIVGSQSWYVLQSVNVPPNVAVEDLRSGHRGTITDLNPQYAAIDLGRAEPFIWQDSVGRLYEGTLYLPSTWKFEQPLPAVLQGGFNAPEIFAIDGSEGAPMAARVFATHGFAVLQMPGLESAARKWRTAEPNGKDLRFEIDGETPMFTMMVEGAIDALSEAGYIDRQKVGLLGFSRIGMLVHYAITFSQYPIAAAVVSDSIELSVWNQTYFYGRYPGMYVDLYAPNEKLQTADIFSSAHATRLPWKLSAIGAQFWGANGISQWMQRSYVFHLDRIRTPILYESRGDLPMPTHWQSYAILKSQLRPVEMYNVPVAQHLLVSPKQAAASKQRALDWFSFWLKNDEKYVDRDSERLERWRLLKKQYELLQTGDPSGSVDPLHGNVLTH